LLRASGTWIGGIVAVLGLAIGSLRVEGPRLLRRWC